MFITFEGADGSGKSTQARLLAARLREEGHDVVLTREPGGSPGAEEIRRLILSGATDRWSPETEILLFTAARRDHLEKTVFPALERGAIVISDRFADSTRVYQGAARNDLRETVDAVHRLMIDIEPDLTIVMVLDPEEGLRRGNARNAVATVDEGRFERMGQGFQDRLVAGFAMLPAHFPDRCLPVNAGGGIEAVAERVMAVIGPLLARPRLETGALSGP